MDIKRCDNCGYYTKCEQYRKPPSNVWETSKKHTDFCDVCAYTYLSKAHNYSAEVSDARLYQSIGWIANLIIDVIGREKAEAIFNRQNAFDNDS